MENLVRYVDRESFIETVFYKDGSIYLFKNNGDVIRLYINSGLSEVVARLGTNFSLPMALNGFLCTGTEIWSPEFGIVPLSFDFKNAFVRAFLDKGFLINDSDGEDRRGVLVGFDGKILDFFPENTWSFPLGEKSGFLYSSKGVDADIYFYRSSLDLIYSYDSFSEGGFSFNDFSGSAFIYDDSLAVFHPGGKILSFSEDGEFIKYSIANIVEELGIERLPDRAFSYRDSLVVVYDFKGSESRTRISLVDFSQDKVVWSCVSDKWTTNSYRFFSVYGDYIATILDAAPAILNIKDGSLKLLTPYKDSTWYDCKIIGGGWAAFWACGEGSHCVLINLDEI